MEKETPGRVDARREGEIGYVTRTNIAPSPDNDNYVNRLDAIRDLRLRRNCEKIFSELGPTAFYYMFAQPGAERSVRTYLENLAELYASLDREAVERLGRLHLPAPLLSVVDGGRS